MAAKSQRRKVRPSYPSLARQCFGLYLTLLVIVGMDFAVKNGYVHDPGGVYLLLVIVVTFISALRTGLIAVGLILAYLSISQYIPGSGFEHTPWKDRHVEGLAIVLSFFALTIGLIQGKLRAAAIREFDALASADTETAKRKQTEGMWQLVMDSAMDAIVAMGEDGRISLWNRNAEAMFGWKSEDVLGQKVADTIIPPSFREEHEKGLRRFVDTGEANILGKRLEMTGLTSDGREFPIELTVVPHKPDGSYIFVAFIRDMTEPKKLSERLRQAQKMEAVGTLAGGIAHDFNNILTSISGNLALAQADTPAGHPAQESHAEIEKAVTRATYVVRQILRFSTAGEAKAEAINLEDTLTEAIKLLRATVPASMEIEQRFEPGLPPIVADSTDLHQVVLNLGINAHHAMQGRSGKFEVSAVTTQIDESAAESLLSVAPGDYVRISFRDTGLGMDSQTLQRAFEPFFTTKAYGEGTGLGLSVVYGIVERHHGAITVYSDPGKGTVFHIYFPVAQTAVEKTSSQANADLPGHGERILHVDDDEALVFMMARMLRRLNYEVTGFQDPNEALEAFRNAPDSFDIVITDMSMPHMDGPELVNKLKEIRPDIPIVMVTGYIRPTDLEKAHNLGINRLILKPNTIAEMSETLHQILRDLRE